MDALLLKHVFEQTLQQIARPADGPLANPVAQRTVPPFAEPDPPRVLHVVLEELTQIAAQVGIVHDRRYFEVEREGGPADSSAAGTVIPRLAEGVEQQPGAGPGNADAGVAPVFRASRIG